MPEKIVEKPGADLLTSLIQVTINDGIVKRPKSDITANQ
jgi:hypothetical protein